MDTRRTLEGEFLTVREGATPGGTPTIVIGGNAPTATTDINSTVSRKRRLTTASITSIGDDPTVTIQLGDRQPARGYTSSPRQENHDSDALLQENERLRFELENAKALQQVLESNSSDLRDQLMKEKLMKERLMVSGSAEGNAIPDRLDVTDRAMDRRDSPEVGTAVEGQNGNNEESDEIDRDYRIARTDLNNALEELSSAKDTITRLQLALSTAETSRDATAQQNESLQSALVAARGDAEQAAIEKNQLQARVATLEGQVLAATPAATEGSTDHATNTGSAFETTLELQVLANKLSASQQNLMDTTKSLEEAHSKIRLLEQTLQRQDDDHLSYVQTKDELAGWKTIFQHVDPNPTPDTLLRHIRELESKLERAELAIAASPSAKSQGATTDDATRRLADLENNVVSLEQENLELHQRLKSLKTSLESAETTNARLTHQLGSGAFNPETTKVLHMKRNPFTDQKLAQLQVEIDTLQGENQVLKARCAGDRRLGGDANLGAGIADGAQAAATALELATTQGKLTATEKKLANSEKANKRLQQIFSQQIATFRESITLLFGWKLDMTSDPKNKTERARLSLTIEGKRGAPADKQKRLMFRMVEPSTSPATPLVLVDTPFSKKHQKAVDTCIHAMGSIPLFIANLTLDDIQNRPE